MIKKLMTSPKTTIAGLLAIIGTLCIAFRALMDNDPATVPDWNEVILAFNGFLLATGLIAARKAFRLQGDRFTQSDAAKLRDELLEKIAAVPPLTAEYKQKIAEIEKLAREGNDRLIRIETLLQQKGH